MTTETTALTVQDRAALALESSTAETYLIELAVKSKAITAITNKDGRTECHAAAMTAKDARINIEKAGKSAREDATAFSRAVIAEEKRLVDLIAPEEKRLIELRDVWDANVKAEKEAAEAIERERVAAEHRAAEAKRQAEERIKLDAEHAELDRQRKEIADAKAEQERIATEEIRKIDEQRKAQAMERAKQLAEEANAAMPDEAQKQTVADHIEQPLALVDQLPDATKMIDDRSGPRITSLRIQISDELGKMNVFELGNVLAYCQALPLKNKLAA